MNRILEKVRATLKLGRDLLINILYSGGAYSLKEIREGLLCNYFWDVKGLIGILENIRATLKMGRGLFRINSMWGRVYLRKGKIGRASLEEN